MFKFLKDKLKRAVSAIKSKITKAREEEVEKEVKEVEKQAKDGVEIKVEKKKTLIEKIKQKLTTFTLNDVEFDKVFWELEKALLENNVAIVTIGKIRDDLKEKLVGKSIKRGKLEEEIKNSLKETLEEILLDPLDFIKEVKQNKPYVIVFFGINGSGKTTTIARITHLLQKNKLSCVLAAGDTFRAASIEQLEEHAKKLRVEVIKHKYGADPAAVAFDAIAHAKARKIDVVLIDTAGRMHSNVDLMQEMSKICRVASPNMKVFVGEAIIGNDAVQQARSFDEKIGVDAVILTKADVDEKGGAAISVSNVTGKPILFLGTGQKYNDLEVFNKDKIIKSLGL